MRWSLLLLAITTVAAFAQIGGPGEYPQFRSMSGLPGSGYGVKGDGSIHAMGAWSISTPIAYGLQPWQFALGVGSLSPNSTPRFLDTSTGESKGNGTGQITVGLPIGKYGQATYTFMILSGRLDNAGNLTWTPPGQNGPIRFGAGVQDISGGGGTQGEGPGGLDPGSSRSFFVVGTWEGPYGIHASLGKGTNRFQRVFGNASANITPNSKVVVEHDGFNWNVGLGYDFGSIGKSPREGADLGASVFLGLIRGKYAYWSLGFRF